MPSVPSATLTSAKSIVETFCTTIHLVDEPSCGLTNSLLDLNDLHFSCNLVTQLELLLNTRSGDCQGITSHAVPVPFLVNI